MSRYRFIAAEAGAGRHTIALLCRVLKLSRAGSDGWRGRGEGARATADARLSERITAVHAASRRTYGSPRVHAALRADGVRVARKRVARLMRQAGLRGHGRAG